jgi:hypothetical protein
MQDAAHRVLEALKPEVEAIVRERAFETLKELIGLWVKSHNQGRLEGNWVEEKEYQYFMKGIERAIEVVCLRSQFKCPIPDIRWQLEGQRALIEGFQWDAGGSVKVKIKWEAQS